MSVRTARDARGARALDAETDRRLQEVWKQAYAAKDQDDLRALYARWAETYDQDHERVGFFGHRLTAAVLARHLTRRDVAAVLDAGAGTGAAGEALHELGFRNLTAVDLSAEMLDVAREKGLYRDLHEGDLSLPIDALRDRSYDGAALVGVFSFGQAPAETLDEILRVVRPGGAVAFTLRCDFFEQDAMGVRSRMEELERLGAWSLVERTDPQPYLPNKDPDATFSVWCYRVTRGLDPEVEDGFAAAARKAFAGARGGSPVVLDHAWIWDSTASRLYDRYTECDGYYLTDSEEEILRERSGDIWDGEPLIVELGCGSARKIRHVLEACLEEGGRSVRYMPIDVSHGALESTAQEVEELFPENIEVEPRQGLFDDVLGELPERRKKLVFFFGSSLGNLHSLEETVAFLERLREQLGADDRLVLGLDLHKDRDVLDAAYDRDETCRSFFVHMLRRVNRVLGAEFDPRAFELDSTYEREPEWRGLCTHAMKLRVAPREAQRTFVRGLGTEVELDAGQPVQVGVSRKFEPDQIVRLAELAGFRVERQSFDRNRWFSLNELAPDDGRA